MSPAVGKRRPEDLEFKANLNCLERPILYERVKWKEGGRAHVCAGDSWQERVGRRTLTGKEEQSVRVFRNTGEPEINCRPLPLVITAAFLSKPSHVFTNLCRSRHGHTGLS